MIPVKIFEIREHVDFESVVRKLEDHRREETYESDTGKKVNLVTEILDLKLDEGVVKGIFSKDFVRKRYYRRELVETPVTEEAPFWIKPFGGRTFLMVSAPSVARGVKKLLTNHVANALSEALFNKIGFVVEARINPDVLKELHESNPQATKLIWFDDVDIPSVEKLCLAGSGLADTGLYHEYINHGKIWYVVFEAQKRGAVVGITRNCVVTQFSRSTLDKFMEEISEDILSLIK